MSGRNENRPGYKHTKVGWIPENWDAPHVREIGRVITGSTPRTDTPLYYGGPFPFVSPGDLAETKYVCRSEKTLSEEGFASCRPIPEGGILFTCIGSTIGKMAIAGRSLATNQQINAIVVSEAASAEYVYYALLQLSPKVRLLAGEQAVPIINKREFSSFRIPMPPVIEQERIAEVLSAWDKAIGNCELLIMNYELLKKGLMQQLLTGRLRFPEFEPRSTRKEISKSTLSEGWRMFEFSEFAELRREQINPQTHKQDFMCVELEHLDQRSGRLVGCTSSKMQASTKNRFQKGDILFGKLRPYLRKFWHCDREGVCSTEAWVIKAKNSKCISRYLFYIVQEDRFVSAANITSGSKMPRADWTFVSKQPFGIPGLSEQNKIASCLSSVDRDIELLTQKHDRLQEQKKGLMQKLLTGEVRIRN